MFTYNPNSETQEANGVDVHVALPREVLKDFVPQANSVSNVNIVNTSVHGGKSVPSQVKPISLGNSTIHHDDNVSVKSVPSQVKE